MRPPLPPPPRHPTAKIALEEPDQALLGYLQALLDEIPPEAGPEPVAEPVPAKVAAGPVPTAPPPPPPVVQVPAPAVATAAPAREAPDSAEPGPVAATAPETGADVPEWAREPFQVLCFTSDGLALGLPLLALRGIVRLEGRLARLPGAPPWHRGILLARGEKVGVVDLGRLLRPRDAGIAPSTRGYVLLLDGGSWGLACESLGNARRLDPKAVSWRRTGSRVPLIQGVIREGLTPLLAAREILERLRG